MGVAPRMPTINAKMNNAAPAGSEFLNPTRFTPAVSEKVKSGATLLSSTVSSNN